MLGPWPHLSAAAFTREAVVAEPRDLEPVACPLVLTRFAEVTGDERLKHGRAPLRR